MDAFWLYLHILLLVFWVGTDVGVFIAAKWSERSALSIETRQTVLQLGMVLDRLPRSALTLIIPSGCQLAVASGWLQLSGAMLGGMWLFAALWLAILWRGFLSSDPKTQEQSAKINWLLNLVLALVVSAAGVYSLTLGDSAGLAGTENPRRRGDLLRRGIARPAIQACRRPVYGAGRDAGRHGAQCRLLSSAVARLHCRARDLRFRAHRCGAGGVQVTQSAHASTPARASETHIRRLLLLLCCLA